MATVRILQMPAELRSEMFFINKEDIQRVRDILHMYLILPKMQVNALHEGEELAEEMFDLTNNPSRQDERMERYGNGRSLSSGDVVRTEEGDFLCCAHGWAKL